MDQNRITDFVNVTIGESAPGAGTATLTTGFAAGGNNAGHVRLMTTLGSSTSNGTELSTSGGYVAGTGISFSTGSSGAFSAAAYGSGAGTTATVSTLTQTNMPASTIVGIEIWDNANHRWWWGSLTSNVTTNSGDTLTFSPGGIAITLSA